MHVEEMRTRTGAREGEVIGAGSGARTCTYGVGRVHMVLTYRISGSSISALGQA